MFDRVPVPTDNIYKFYALFSLVAVIFFMWQALKINADTNALVFQTYPEIEELKALENPSISQVAKLAALDRQVDIATHDRDFKVVVLGGSTGLFLCVMGVGFLIWHTKIQPLADAQNRAQLEILQLQVEQLKLENQKLAESLKTDELPPVVPSPPQPSVLAQVVAALLTRR